MPHIRKGDTVAIIAGRERGKRGKVLRVLREAGLALSNVLLVCGRCDKPSRAGIKVLGDGRKVRVCKRCGETIDKG